MTDIIHSLSIVCHRSSCNFCLHSCRCQYYVTDLTYGTNLCVCTDPVQTTRAPISFPETAIILVSGGDWDLWPDGILSPQIADFRLHCAESKVKPKMAERSGPDTFLEGVKYGLEKLGKANITLKPKQEEILKIIALRQKDVLAVLPTGYGKSLIYQIMPPLMDYMDSGQRPTQKKSIVLVVSPLNALIKGSDNEVKAEWSESVYFER